MATHGPPPPPPSPGSFRRAEPPMQRLSSLFSIPTDCERHPNINSPLQAPNFSAIEDDDIRDRDRSHSRHRESHKEDIGAAKGRRTRKDHYGDHHKDHAVEDDFIVRLDERMEHVGFRGRRMAQGSRSLQGKGDASAGRFGD